MRLNTISSMIATLHFNLQEILYNTMAVRITPLAGAFNQKFASDLID